MIAKAEIILITPSLQVQQSINKKDQNNSAKCDIHINNFDLMYGEKKLLLDASLTINFGHRLETRPGIIDLDLIYISPDVIHSSLIFKNI